MNMNNNEDVIPTGSSVPASVGETPAPVVEEQQPAAPVVEDQKGGDDPMASLQTQLANAEKLIGRQGKELGELRQSYTALSEQAQQSAEASGNVDYETRVAEIQQQVDSGDIDYGQALRLMAQVSVEEGANLATSKIQNQLKQDETRKVQQSFLEANPDFTELVDSGALDALKQANPLHDDVSAYYEYQAKSKEAEMAKAIEAARAEGEQKGAKLTEQAKKAEGVLGKQGSNVRDTKSKTSFSNPAEKKEAMLEALRGARAS